MRVGMLTTSYPRYPGDPRGVFVKNLADALREEGIDVEVIEPSGYERLKSGAGLLPNLQASNVARLLFPFYCVSFLVRAISRARACDVLHANWSLSGFFAVLAARLSRRPVLLTERSPFLIATRNAVVNRWMRWVMMRCDDVVTISDSARDDLAAKFPDVNIGVVPNGVDDRLFAPEGRDEARSGLGFEGTAIHVVTVGRLTPIKCLDTLLSALASLNARGRDVRAWIVGDGELRDAIDRQVATNPDLKGRVECVGHKPQDEVARWLAAADVFVLTSAGETGGNVVLESMSSGVPVVSTRVGWAADFIVSGENGIIVPVKDEESLARELDALVANGERRRDLGAAARRTIEERGLNWRGCARSYIERYRELSENG